MTWGMVAVAGASLVGGVMSSNAAGDAADAQSAAAQQGIDAQNQRFSELKTLLAPYAQAGTGALQAQGNLIGLGGASAQQQSIDALQNSPMFQSMLKQGEGSILANASATGGLRGGNTQAALAQFAPRLLAQQINDQYNRLGGLTSIGQNAAAMQGNAGMQVGSSTAGLLQQAGAAQAGGILGQTSAINQTVGNLAGFGAQYLNRPAVQSTGGGAYDWVGAERGVF
jgi:hypothetical protein